MDWKSYHRLSDIYGYLTYLSTTYPKLVQLIKIGTSYEGRPLYVVRISNSASTKPAIWIDGGSFFLTKEIVIVYLILKENMARIIYKGIHAREWISPATATYIIQQLVEVPANAKLLEKVNWYIMPVMNPDGINNFIYNTFTDKL